MPPKKKTQKPSQEADKQQNDPSRASEVEVENSQNGNDLEFFSNDQVLWFRNIIRAQGKDVLKELLDEKWRKLHEENEALKKQLTEQQDYKLEQFKRDELVSFKTENQRLWRRIERLEMEGHKKSKKILELQVELDKMEQKQYENDVQIVGLKETENEEEDLKKILKISRETMGCKIKKADVKNIHRLGKKSNDKPRDVIIKFADHSTRKKFYENRKKISPHKDTTRNIYINDHLTNYRKGLFFSTRKLLKSKKLYAAWTQNGNVLIRKTENGAIKEIQSHEALAEYMDKFGLPRISSDDCTSGTGITDEDFISHLSDYSYWAIDRLGIIWEKCVKIILDFHEALCL